MRHPDSYAQKLQGKYPHCQISTTVSGLEILIPSSRPIFRAIHIFVVWADADSSPVSARVAYEVNDNLPGGLLMEHKRIEFTSNNAHGDLGMLVDEEIQNAQARKGLRKFVDMLSAWW